MLWEPESQTNRLRLSAASITFHLQSGLSAYRFSPGEPQTGRPPWRTPRRLSPMQTSWRQPAETCPLGSYSHPCRKHHHKQQLLHNQSGIHISVCFFPWSLFSWVDLWVLNITVDQLRSLYSWLLLFTTTECGVTARLCFNIPTACAQVQREQAVTLQTFPCKSKTF